MAAQNPLEIQELLDHCISFLAHSTPDLISCASVARPWVQPAQSNLFRCPVFDARAIEKFYHALEASPHLAAYVQELDLNFHHHGIEPTFHALCGLPFPQLEILHLNFGRVFWHPNSPHRIQQMLRLLTSPRLRYVSLDAYWARGESCAHMLSNCSLTIQHLYLDGGRWEAESISYDLLRNSFKSLHLHVADFDSDFPGASDRPAQSFPFDSSNLEALAISGESIPWNTICKTKIQILSLEKLVIYLSTHLRFFGKQGSTDLNLALFPRLHMLLLDLDKWAVPDVLAMLRTINSENTIRTIVVSVYTDQTDELELNMHMEALDGALSSLSLTCLSTVEVEHVYWGRQPPDDVARLRDHFPRSLARNLLRLSARNHDSKAKRWQNIYFKLAINVWLRGWPWAL
ncbi:hypothetical protein R3P38DRAFT_3360586 [Favolaschia claudopus]|uniref:F-box domain-containing protein n=1 Tax=Favolaschia claudopus TaxID=2862362 RepID=A0AAW0AWG7_9AGAR